MPGTPKQSVQYFDHLCSTEAGEWIFRKIQNVEGFYFARPQGAPTTDTMTDPYGPEMPEIFRAKRAHQFHHKEKTMGFVLEKLPQPGEPWYEFYELIQSRTGAAIRNDWVIDKEKKIVLFYTGNNSRCLADAKYREHYFRLMGENLNIGVYKEIVSEEKKPGNCLLIKINLQLSEVTAELWQMAKNALIVHGDYGVLSEYSSFELEVLNDDVIKGVQ